MSAERPPRSLEALLAQIGGTPPLFVDLTYGGWRPHQAAFELSLQLDCAPPHQELLTNVPSQPAEIEFVDIVGHGIDSEARGEAVLLMAGRQARRIAELLDGEPARIAVLAPRFGFSWGEENWWFLELLTRELTGRGLPPPLYLTAPGNGCALPQGGEVLELLLDAPRKPAGIAGWHPGILDPELARAPAIELADSPHLVLRGGCALLHPTCRRDPRAAAREEFDRYTAAVAGRTWEEAFGLCFGHPLFVRAPVLVERAWQAFASGAVELALRLGRRAEACSYAPLERAVALASLQGIRIATHRFEEAAAAPDPPPAGPAHLGRFLCLTRGWGRVMTGDPEGAEHDFEAVGDEARGEADPYERLYLDNIRALHLLRRGESVAARRLEEAIREALDAMAEPDSRLVFVNALNLARLARRAGEIERSARFYRRAFRTSDGLRSPSEHVHRNVIEAAIAASRGDDLEAARCWLRAALHWLSMEVPEALGVRATAAVLESPAPPPGLRAGALARAFLARIGEGRNGDHEPPVIRALADSAEPIVEAAGAPGVGWLVGARSRRLPYREGEHALACRIAAHLRALGATLPEGGAIVIDDRHGLELPRTLPELALAALERGARYLRWGERVWLLEEARAQTLWAAVEVAPSAALARLELEGPHPFAVWRRHLPPRLLDEDERAWLLRIRTGTSIGALARTVQMTPSAAGARLSPLAAERLVQLRLGEEACIAAGIS